MSNSWSRMPRGVLVGALSISLASAGCTKTIDHRIARYQPGAQPTTRPVPAVAFYKVKVYGRDGQLHGIDGTERLLQKGDVVGFRTGDDGIVHAVANTDVFPLPPTLRGRKVVWTAQYERQTQFGREVSKALTTGGELAAGAAVVGLFAASVALTAAADDESDDDAVQSHHKHHHHHDERH
jgi:hypothetical protein